MNWKHKLPKDEQATDGWIENGDYPQMNWKRWLPTDVLKT